VKQEGVQNFYGKSSWKVAISKGMNRLWDSEPSLVLAVLINSSCNMKLRNQQL